MMLKKLFTKTTKSPGDEPEQAIDPEVEKISPEPEAVKVDVKKASRLKKNKNKPAAKSSKAQFIKESRKSYVLSAVAVVMLFFIVLTLVSYAVTGFLIPEINRLEAVKLGGENAQKQLPALKKQLSSVKKQIQQAELAFGTSSDGLMSRGFFNSRINEFVAVLEFAGGQVESFCVGSLKGGLSPCDVRPPPEPAPQKNKRRKTAKPAPPENIYTRAFKDKTLGGVFETVGQFVIEPEKKARGRRASNVSKLKTKVGVDGVTIKASVDSLTYLNARDVLFSELPNLILLKEDIAVDAKNLLTIHLELTYPYAGQ